MKTRNISKLFGEWGINLKDRLLSIIKYVFALIFAITAVVTLFYFFDENLNGLFVDWFADKFVGNEAYGYAALDYYH